MATQSNNIGHIARNGSMVMEEIVRSRKTSKREKIYLLQERLLNMMKDLIEVGRVLDDVNRKT